MSRERNQSADVQHTIVSPNDAMNSYIGDLLYSGTETGTDSECVSELNAVSESSALQQPDTSVNRSLENDSSSASLLSISNSIKPGFSLIPLASLKHYQLDLSNPRRSLSASFVLLLWGLHLLRMPIAGRLRLSVFEHCRQRLMEYRLLTDITRLPSAGGNHNEQ